MEPKENLTLEDQTFQTLLQMIVREELSVRIRVGFLCADVHLEQSLVGHGPHVYFLKTSGHKVQGTFRLNRVESINVCRSTTKEPLFEMVLKPNPV